MDPDPTVFYMDTDPEVIIRDVAQLIRIRNTDPVVKMIWMRHDRDMIPKEKIMYIRYELRDEFHKVSGVRTRRT